MSVKKPSHRQGLAKTRINAPNANSRSTGHKLLSTIGRLSSTLEEDGMDGTPTLKECSVRQTSSKPSVKRVTTPKQKTKIKNGRLLGSEHIVTHTKKMCKGKFCCFHNPSNHNMVEWDMYIRFDRGCLVERICPKHRVGHPDPDSLAWINRNGVVDHGIHGCCGCHKEESK